MSAAMMLSADSFCLKSAYRTAYSFAGNARQSLVAGCRSPAHKHRHGAAALLVVCDASQKQSTAVVTVTSAEPPVASVGKLEITLPGLEALQTVRLGLVPQGKGQAIVVTEVAEGSTAEQLGVRRGQRLNALSDPMRYGTMWSLEDRPSLRFVVDTFKMRRSSPIDLEFEPLVSAEDMDVIFGTVSSSSAANTAGAEGSAAAGRADTAAGGSSTSSRGSGSGSNGAPDASPDALGSLSSMDQLLGSGSSSEGEETLGERLAAKYAAQQRARMTVNEVQKRIDRRKAYMEIDDQRDDTGLLLGLAAAFLLPALVILVVAYFTGYLDRLYLTALTLR